MTGGTIRRGLKGVNRAETVERPAISLSNHRPRFYIEKAGFLRVMVPSKIVFLDL